VLPEYQRHGIGAALIEVALAAARHGGIPLVFLEGTRPTTASAASSAPTLTVPRPVPADTAARVPVARLPGYEPWMTGTLVYSDVFWSHDCVGLR